MGIVNITLTTDEGPSIPSAADQFMYIAFRVTGSLSIQAIQSRPPSNIQVPGNTIILNPGIYLQHDIYCDKRTSRSWPTRAGGGNAANTIIDGESCREDP